MKVIGFFGDSGVGKTTLIERLLGRFGRGELRLAAIKHAHHGFDIDRPGKDSFRLRAAGAGQVLIASDQRWALLCDEPAGGEASALAQYLARLAPCDLVFVEGFRNDAAIPFIEVRRFAVDRAPGARAPAASVIAVAADARTAAECAGLPVPLLDLDDVDAIARFIAQKLAVPLC